MISLDDYVFDVLLRDLVGHDRRPVCFLVYVWLAAESERRGGALEVSYRELAGGLGVSKSSVRGAGRCPVRRKLSAVTKSSMPAPPCYSVLTPWRKGAGQRKVK